MNAHANTIADPRHHPDVVVDESLGSDDRPPVESMSRRTSWQGPLMIAGAVGVLFAVGGALAYTYIGKKLPTTGKDPATTATASAANAPGAARSFAATPPALSLPPAPAASAPAVATNAIFPAADAGEVRPIEVRGDGSAARSSSGRSGQREVSPDDGPVLIALASSGRGAQQAAMTGSQNAALPGSPTAGSMTRTAGTTAAAPGAVGGVDTAELQRSLATTQQNLGAMVDRLIGGQRNAQGGVAAADGAGGALPGTLPGMPGMPAIPGLAPQGQGAPAGGGLFGGQLQSSATSPAMARHLGNRSLVLPKGSTFTCALKTKVISAVSGLVGCQVLRNVYSDDGRTVLIERGSHLDGEYRITQVRPGVTRVPTIWTRVRTPHGIVVDIESPAVGPLGESGLPAHVDNRWMERLGAALLVGFIDDVLQILINRADNTDGDTIVLGSGSAAQGRTIPEKILESTINIPPLLTQNQGGLVGVYIARDVDFSPVYALRATDIPLTSNR